MLAKVLVLFLAIAAKEVASQACHMREVDLCMAIGMFHYQSNGVPSNDEQVNEWCEIVKEVSDCGGNFSAKCLSQVQKELLGLLSGGSEEAQNEICTVGTELRSRYMKHAVCLSNGAESDIFKSHIKDLQAAVERVFDTSFKKRLPTLCCGFRRFHVNVGKSTEEMCGADAVDMLEFFINMMVTELPNILCQTYDPNSSQCQDLLPALGTTPKGSESSSSVAKLMDTVLGNL